MRHLLLLGLAGLLLAGCAKKNAAPTLDMAAQGQKFLLTEEPAGAVGILDYRETTPADAAPTGEVVLLGRIGGAKQTWSSQSAEFFISDPAHAVGGDHVCHSENCPFCKNKGDGNQSLAVVALTDEAGHVPAVDARRLLPIEEGQMVVVRGQVEIDQFGQLVVHAKGLYLRR